MGGGQPLGETGGGGSDFCLATLSTTRHCRLDGGLRHCHATHISSRVNTKQAWDGRHSLCDHVLHPHPQSPISGLQRCTARLLSGVQHQQHTWSTETELPDRQGTHTGGAGVGWFPDSIVIPFAGPAGRGGRVEALMWEQMMHGGGRVGVGALKTATHHSVAQREGHPRLSARQGEATSPPHAAGHALHTFARRPWRRGSVA